MLVATAALLDTLREDPEANSFHYLQKFPTDDFPANPYHLQVVQHDEIDKNDFVTLSASGVTVRRATRIVEPRLLAFSARSPLTLRGVWPTDEHQRRGAVHAARPVAA